MPSHRDASHGRPRPRRLTEGIVAEQTVPTIGSAGETWTSLRAMLAERYPDLAPGIDYGGARYGWQVRYRKGGRLLVSLFPEQDGFTSLVELGRAEDAKAEAILDRLSPAMQRLLGGTAQLHDGRWLWIRWPEDGTVEDVRELIQLRRRPRRP